MGCIVCGENENLLSLLSEEAKDKCCAAIVNEINSRGIFDKVQDPIPEIADTILNVMFNQSNDSEMCVDCFNYELAEQVEQYFDQNY